MDKVRILYPMLHYPPVIGGMEQCAKNIAERQPGDIEIFIVTGSVRGAPEREKIKNCSIFRYSPIGLNSFHTSWIYIISAFPFIFFNSLYLAKKYKVDALHCYGFMGSAIGYVISKLIARPFISTEQGLTGANSSGIRIATKFFRSMIYRDAKLCVASSKAVAEDFYRLGVRKVQIVPNGVDFNIFSNKQGKYSGKHTILTVGRLEKVKGHSYLINAFEEIKKKIPNAHLVIIGDGSERNNLEKQANDLGIKNSVTFVGEILNNDLPDYYKEADVFVMPSFYEGFGITAIEAMACGVPVVASRVGGLLEIIENGETGILVKPKDSKEIIDAISLLLEDKNLRQSITHKAKEAARKYNWKNIAFEVSKIYRELT